MAVEFQFYLISPFIVARLKGWNLPLTTFALSTLLNIAAYLIICPEYLTRDAKRDTEFNTNTVPPLVLTVYTQVPMRASPYVFGMLAAYFYKNQRDIATSLAYDWISFLALVAITINGVTIV